jgi:hypothetical protein
MEDRVLLFMPHRLKRCQGQEVCENRKGVGRPRLRELGRRRSGGLGGWAGLALDSQDLVAEVSPVAIAAAAMVEDKWRLSGVGIFEPGEQFSGFDTLGTLLALF